MQVIVKRGFFLTIQSRMNNVFFNQCVRILGLRLDEPAIVVGNKLFLEKMLLTLHTVLCSLPDTSFKKKTWLRHIARVPSKVSRVEGEKCALGVTTRWSND